MESEDQFRNFLRDWLERNDWSVPRLSRATGIADPVIRRWLRADAPKRPSDANLRKLAPVLEVPVEQLLRVSGYSLTDVGEIIDGDADFAEIKAVWPRLEDWRRRAIKALAAGVYFVQTPTPSPLRRSAA